MGMSIDRELNSLCMALGSALKRIDWTSTALLDWLFLLRWSTGVTLPCGLYPPPEVPLAAAC